MTEEQAIAIITQVLKDRKAWGETAGIRVAQWELVNALLLLEGRLTGDMVPKAELSKANRQMAQMRAIHEKALGDSARMREERDAAKSLAQSRSR